MKKKRHPLSIIYSVCIFLFLYAPIVVLIVFSFNASKSRGHWGGFSLRWYQSLFENSTLMDALKTTLSVALVSSAIAVVIGTAAALGLYYSKKRVRNLLMNVTSLPMLNADIVTGISLLLLFTFVGLRLGYVSLLLAHITFNIPYVILSVMPKLNQLDKNTFEAALDLGATPLQAFFKVMLPEISPGIVTGFILAFTMSIDDFVISFFTTGADVSTLSVAIYSMTRRGIKPEINALSTLMFVAVLTLLLIVNVRSGRDKQKREKKRF